jgi:hypothetical protein
LFSRGTFLLELWRMVVGDSMQGILEILEMGASGKWEAIRKK